MPQLLEPGVRVGMLTQLGFEATASQMVSAGQMLSAVHVCPVLLGVLTMSLTQTPAAATAAAMTAKPLHWSRRFWRGHHPDPG